jgi:hypothetical protein
MSERGKAWVAFVLSSGLILGTLSPVMTYGVMLVYYPIVLIFGCDGARTELECLGVQLYPLSAPALALLALVWCQIAIARTWYIARACGRNP